MRKWMIFPWYIFLLPLFYVLHAYNSYFGLLSLRIAGLHVLYYLLLSLAFFSIGLIIFKDRVKSGIFTIVFLIIFFFFGVVQDWLQSVQLPAFFTSYKFLLSLILIILTGIAYLLKRTSTSLVRLNRFFQLLFPLILFLEIGITLFYLFTDKQSKANPAAKNQLLNIQLRNTDKSKFPDIFFIVFDEYTSSVALNKYFHFDNSYFDSTLLKNGFYISRYSKSNYNSTPYSIASTFNMQYFNEHLEKAGTMTKLFEGAYALKKSRLPKLLEKQGYTIINHGFLNIDDHPVSVTPAFDHYEMKVFSLETLWGRIRRDIYWHITELLEGGRKKTKPADQNYIAQQQKNFSNFLHELQKDSNQPRFVIGHLFLPRRPAYVDRYGKPRITSMADFIDKNHDSLYLEQLIYANTLIDSLAKAATSKHIRPLVLIIEGDHGNRYAEWGAKIRDKQFMNLNVYYFSDKDYSLLYDSISPVNSFRVVLNKYFSAGLPLLKDSTVLLH